MKKLAERIIGEVNSDLITAIRKGEEVLGINHASLDGMNSSELNEYLNDLRMKCQQKEHKPSSTAEIPQDDVKKRQMSKINKESEILPIRCLRCQAYTGHSEENMTITKIGDCSFAKNAGPSLTFLKYRR